MAAKSIVLIGAGRMGSAMARGWLAADTPPALTIVAARPSPEVTAWATAGKVNLNPSVFAADILVVAVKPQVFGTVSADIAQWAGPKTLVLSVMAGISSRQLQADLGSRRIVRAMPNTPGAIGRGVTLLSPAADVTLADVKTARGLLAPLGAVEGPMSEEMMVAAMTVSGCGPAYLFYLTEALAGAGEAQGLPADLAARLARQTMEGAAALMAASPNDPPDHLRRAVTSPGGVTQAALDVLMSEKGFPSLLREALRAAVARDKALSHKE